MATGASLGAGVDSRVDVINTVTEEVVYTALNERQAEGWLKGQGFVPKAGGKFWTRLGAFRKIVPYGIYKPEVHREGAD